MSELRDRAQSAANILLPKGDDRDPSIDAFQEWADIEIPEFKGRELVVKSGGKVFWLFKGKDIPGLVIKKDDTVGLTGTDSRIEYAYGKSERIVSERIGSEMCRFSLLSMASDTLTLEKLLDSKQTQPTLQVATSKPTLLRFATGNLPIQLNETPISGSVEGALQYLGVPLAADIVQSGETARQNGLEIVKDLLSIYPEVVASAENGTI